MQIVLLCSFAAAGLGANASKRICRIQSRKDFIGDRVENTALNTPDCFKLFLTAEIARLRPTQVFGFNLAHIHSWRLSA